uniref:Beta-Casp domain-containing protein n=1 Tax=Phytophthora ramorum TaxID=164328 RepID=H3GJ78_PHYRM
MSFSVERLGNGAAFCLRDELSSTTVLLGCGEAKDVSFFSGDDAGAEDFEAVTTQYRRELKDLLKRDGGILDAILVPDYRPGACYMLPYVAEKCGVSWATATAAAAQDPSQKQPPAVLMTHGTRAIAPHLLAEYWTGCHGKAKDGGSGLPAPYDIQDIAAAFRKAKAVALKACVTVNENLKVTAYHSGHVAGGCAFYLEIGTTTVLFANDFNLTGGRVLLPAQIPRLEPSALITRSSFAVTVSETQSAMERELVKVILECISSNGKVVIPVYRLGYFHELITILLEHWQQMKDATGKSAQCPIYLSDSAMEYPSRFLPLLSRTCTHAVQNLLRERSPNAADLQVFDWKRLQQPGPFVLFTGPANISQGDSLRAIKAVASDPKNLIVLSEYCTPGTVNYLLYADPEHEVDTKSIVQLVSRVAPRQVILDYTVPDDLAFVQTHVQNQMKMDPTVDTSVTVKGVNPTGRTPIEPARDIPLRIHKAMFNNPSDVQAAVESADEDNDNEEQLQANVGELLKALEASLIKWIRHLAIEKIDRWLKLRTVGVSVSTEWEVHMEWSYDDEALAGRVLGIAKQVIHAEYKKQLAK